MKQPTRKVKLNNNKKTIMPNNLSLYNFYRRIINKKSEFELKNNIKKYIDLINESKSKNDMYNLFLLLINLRNFNLNEKKIYYHILKELLLDYQTIISVIVTKYPPNYGLLNDFKKIYEECIINGTMLDTFKFVLNLNEAIDNQIEIDNQYNNNIDKYSSLLLENNKILNSKDFVRFLNLNENELMSINSLLIVTKEGIFK